MVIRFYIYSIEDLPGLDSTQQAHEWESEVFPRCPRAQISAWWEEVEGGGGYLWGGCAASCAGPVPLLMGVRGVSRSPSLAVLATTPSLFDTQLLRREHSSSLCLWIPSAVLCAWANGESAYNLFIQLIHYSKALSIRIESFPSSLVLDPDCVSKIESRQTRSK